MSRYGIIAVVVVVVLILLIGLPAIQQRQVYDRLNNWCNANYIRADISEPCADWLMDGNDWALVTACHHQSQTEAAYGACVRHSGIQPLRE